MKYLLDSNMIIYHLNGNETATQFLESHVDGLHVSFITIIEVMAFEYSEQERIVVNSFLDSFRRVDVDDGIINTTSYLRLSTKIKLPDCIIAATAITNDLELVTRNVSDFKRFDGLRLVNPFE